MDKEKVENFNHVIKIAERNNILITGVKKLENFDPNEFFIETVMDFLLIKGEDLELIKYDTFQGSLSIKGKVIALDYLEQSKTKAKAESLITRLFK